MRIEGDNTLGAPVPLALMAEETAAVPGFWRIVALDQHGPADDAFCGVAARLGARLDENVVHASGEPPSPQDQQAETLARPVAEHLFEGPAVLTLRQPETPRRRVFRRASPAQPPEAAVPPRDGHTTGAGTGPNRPAAIYVAARPSEVRRDRSALPLAIVLMVGIWAGVVGGAAWFFNTPGSGVKIKWQ